MMYPLECGVVLLLLVVPTFCQEQSTTHILKRDTDIFNQSESTKVEVSTLENKERYLRNSVVEAIVDDKPNGKELKVLPSSKRGQYSLTAYNRTESKGAQHDVFNTSSYRQILSHALPTDSSSSTHESHMDPLQIEKPSEANEDSTAIPTLVGNTSQKQLDSAYTETASPAGTNLALPRLQNVMLGNSAVTHPVSRTPSSISPTPSSILPTPSSISPTPSSISPTPSSILPTPSSISPSQPRKPTITATSSTIPQLSFNIQNVMLGDDPVKSPVKILKSPTPSIVPNQPRKPTVTTTKSPTSRTPTPDTKPKAPREKYFVPTSSKPAIKIKAVTYAPDNVVSKKILILPSTRIPVASKTASSASHAACQGIMPSYRSVVVNGSYDVRDYPLSAWLSTTVITSNRILAELEARNKLQNYFKGDNEKGIVLSRTCPVLTQIKFKGEFTDTKEKVDEYAVSFYLPWNGNSEIPTPNDSEVLVDIVEERNLYVHSFKAYAWEMSDNFLQAEARKLTTELRRQGEPFLSKYFYVASYAKGPVDDEYAAYEIWIYATRSRPFDIALAWQPVKEQPLGEVSRRTRSRVCKGFECPSFEVLSIHKAGIQKRRYYGARFATYDPEFCTFTKASIWRAFMPLHLYKHGVNSHFEVIGATRPAGIVHVKEKHVDDINGTKQACNKTFTVSLYLPKRLHAAPPVAGNSAPRIKITELDDVIVYVQSVGGFLLVPDRIEKEVSLFRSRLKEQNLCFRNGEYYLAVYDYITRFHGRLNEIWTIADRCSDSL